VLQRVGELGLPAVCDAAASTDGRSLAVRNSDEAVFYRSADLIDGRVTPYLGAAD
jgi:hypothetical protein